MILCVSARRPLRRGVRQFPGRFQKYGQFPPLHAGIVLGLVFSRSRIRSALNIESGNPRQGILWCYGVYDHVSDSFRPGTGNDVSRRRAPCFTYELNGHTSGPPNQDKNEQRNRDKLNQILPIEDLHSVTELPR